MKDVAERCMENTISFVLFSKTAKQHSKWNISQQLYLYYFLKIETYKVDFWASKTLLSSPHHFWSTFSYTQTFVLLFGVY